MNTVHLRRVFDLFDNNNSNGQIMMDKLALALKSLGLIAGHTGLTTGMRVYVHEGMVDVRGSAADLQEVLKKLGLSQGSNHATVCKMICNIGRDGDGVDFGEFKCMM
ncbi:hypothetical protein QYE76_048864 [Lolium multiflorum]|uniref:Uncharacterized protein n=1 Tax=Lolium multiflorum TaxID=4521 RepID=A0AAD8SN10_LOLMU|nr:hypothetical protein QYE76_048864 [Lolium multiflorum]